MAHAHKRKKNEIKFTMKLQWRENVLCAWRANENTIHAIHYVYNELAIHREREQRVFAVHKLVDKNEWKMLWFMYYLVVSWPVRQTATEYRYKISIAKEIGSKIHAKRCRLESCYSINAFPSDSLCNTCMHTVLLCATCKKPPNAHAHWCIFQQVTAHGVPNKFQIHRSNTLSLAMAMAVLTTTTTIVTTTFCPKEWVTFANIDFSCVFSVRFRALIPFPFFRAHTHTSHTLPLAPRFSPFPTWFHTLFPSIITIISYVQHFLVVFIIFIRLSFTSFRSISIFETLSSLTVLTGASFRQISISLHSAIIFDEIEVIQRSVVFAQSTKRFYGERLTTVVKEHSLN